MSQRAVRISLVVVVMFGTVGVTAMRVVLVQRANEARRDHARVVRRAELVRDFEITYVSEAASIRAFFLAGRGTSLQEYYERRAHATDLNARLRRALGASSGAVQLDAVADAAHAWDDAIQGLVATQDVSARARTAIITSYRQSGAAQRFQSVTTAVDRLRATIDASVEPSAHTADTARSRAARFTLASWISAVALLLVLIGATARG
jgi:CHASE3 domain sensor protein